MTDPELTPGSVVWWRTSLALAEIPHRHTIGWCDTTGAPHDTITIVSPHPRLDRRTIETALAEDLALTYPIPLQLGLAAEMTDQLTAEARRRPPRPHPQPHQGLRGRRTRRRRRHPARQGRRRLRPHRPQRQRARPHRRLPNSGTALTDSPRPALASSTTTVGNAATRTAGNSSSTSARSLLLCLISVDKRRIVTARAPRACLPIGVAT
jgi:hypothetical protein